MKSLLALVVVFSVTAFADDGPTCSELDSMEQARLGDIATEYFWTTIAKEIKADPKVTMVYGSFKGAEYYDCHDYDSEFDHMEFELKWQQKVGRDKTLQECTQVVGVNRFDEMEVPDDARECKDL